MCARRVTPHTSTRYSGSCHAPVNMGASVFFTAVIIRAFSPARSRGSGTLRIARNALCTVTTDLLCDIPTHKTTSPPERPFSHYIHSHRLAAEIWTTTKNNLLGKKFLSCSFYLHRFRKYVSYGFPTINLCNPGVHYGTPCRLRWREVSDSNSGVGEDSSLQGYYFLSTGTIRTDVSETRATSIFKV